MNEYASDAPISMPVFMPESELVYMNGFAFSQDNGIVLSTVQFRGEWLDFVDG